MVLISEKQYLFLHSDTGYQLSNDKWVKIRAYIMSKGLAMCNCWGWPKFN